MANEIVQFRGVLYHIAKGYGGPAEEPVVFQGVSTSVGGGGGKPPDLGIWPGPGDPDFPGGGGGGGGEPPWGGVGKPPGVSHPIWPPYVPGHPLPNPPDKPPVDPPTEPPTDPPNSNWEWVWNPAGGWHPAYVPGDKPRPLP